MINKFRFVFTVFFALLLAGSFSVANAQQARKVAPPPPPNPLVELLPDSDVVVSVNTQKLINVALPQFLGAKSPTVTQLNTWISTFKTQTGIDLRQIQYAAVGIKYKQISATEMDFEPVILAGGKINALAIMALLKMGATGKYREIQSGGKTIFVLPLKDVAGESKEAKEVTVEPKENENKSPAAPAPPAEAKNTDKIFGGFKGELAIGALDDHTFAIGTVARVEEAFAGAAALNPELVSAVNVKPGALISFSGKMPADISKLLGLGTDEFAKMADSVRVVSGYLDLNGVNASLMVAAKTETPEQAASIEATITGLREIGKAIVGGTKGPEKAVFTRMINNALITRTGGQVQLKLSIPQADLNVLAKKL